MLGSKEKNANVKGHGILFGTSILSVLYVRIYLSAYPSNQASVHPSIHPSSLSLICTYLFIISIIYHLSAISVSSLAFPHLSSVFLFIIYLALSLSIHTLGILFILSRSQFPHL